MGLLPQIHKVFVLIVIFFFFFLFFELLLVPCSWFNCDLSVWCLINEDEESKRVD